ncbi:MAG: AsmA-like C-terminal region-containing protein, partial [bacterium]
RKLISEHRDLTAPAAAVALVVIASSAAGYAAGRIALSRISSGIEAYVQDALGVELRTGRVIATPLLQIVMEDVRVAIPGEGGKETLPVLEARRMVLYPSFGAFAGGRKKLRAVLLEDPLMNVYRDRGGKLNLSPWLDAALECADGERLNEFPERLNVRNGTLLFEPRTRGGGNAAAVGGIDGVIGRGRRDRVVFELLAETGQGVVGIEGFVSPCTTRELFLEADSERIDFDGLVEALGLPGAEPGTRRKPLSIGEGSFRLKGSGAIDNPAWEGSLKTADCEARFGFTERLLNVADVRCGAGGGELSGAGSVDFRSANFPARFSFFFEGWKTSKMARGLTGFQYAPETVITGYYKLQGSLKDAGSFRATGNVESRGGKLFFPPLVVTGREGAPKGRESLAFERFSARILYEDGRLNLLGVELRGENFVVSGKAELRGAAGLMRKWERKTRFDASVGFAAPDISAVLDETATMKNIVSGGMEGELFLAGAAASPAGFRGGGSVRLTGGSLVNPYLWGARWGAGRIDFDEISASFKIAGGSLNLSGLTLNGNGIFVEMKGGLSFDGELSMKGRAEVNGDVARGIGGLAGAAADRRDLVGAVRLEAPFAIGGTLNAPEMVWGRARATRWTAR